MQINHKELKEQIKISYETKLPLFIWGSVGIGKSDSVFNVAKDIAKSENLELCEGEERGKFGFIDVRISQLEPSDLRGIPSIDNEHKVCKWLPPNWLPKLQDSKGILFFDELNLSPPSIQATAYQLILNRKVGDYKLPKDWVIISAGNRIEDICNVFEMSSALCNRFLHCELTIPDKDEWTEWALKNEIDSRIISFIQFKPSSLYRFDNKMRDKAFPTPRSHAYSSKLIKGRDNIELIDKLVASAVGEATAKEFVAFLRLQNKIDIKELLDKPELVKRIKEMDLKYILLGTIAEYYRKDKKILNKTFGICENLEPEYAILLLRFLKGINPTQFSKEIIGDKAGSELLRKYSDILV